MINYEVAMRMIKLILWALGAVWSLFMILENNKYFSIRKDEEKNILACNLLMVLSIIRVVKVIH